ncbi:elongation factor G [bacterium]|nr:elongation factor G [bacterium]
MHNSHLGQNIHNIAFVGKDGVGKTTLADNLVKINTKQKSLDYVIQPEEESRGFTIYNRMFHFDDGENTFNILDTPGNTDFLASIKSALFASTGAVFVASALSGVGSALRVWESVVESNTPRAIFINMVDHPEANLDNTLQSLESSFSIRPVVLYIPYFEGDTLVGIIDVINQKVISGEPGKLKEVDLPDEAKESVEQYRSSTYERLAEMNDELMEFYIEEKPAPDDLLIKVMTEGVKSCEITPVMVGSAELNIGLETLYTYIKTNFPSHAKGKTWVGKASKEVEAEVVERKPDASEPFSGFVFRTTFDRYVGKLSFIKVLSGTLKKGVKFLNIDNSEKITTGRISIVNGDKSDEIEEAYPGDIVIIEKEDDLASNQTICDVNSPIRYEKIKFLEPRCTYKLELTNSSKDGRIIDALNKLIAQDPSMTMRVDPDTKEVLFSGKGTVHLEVAQEHLKNVYEVEINLAPYQISYREAIVGKATVQGKYKKQSGGHGQYGDVHITIEPTPRGTGFEFVDKIVGGAIPRNYIPSVEKGVREALLTGCLAGCPVDDVRVILFDGTFHAVDSSDFAFQRAGVMAINKALPLAKPVILEPVMEIAIDVLEADVGKVTKDLSGRRGKVSSYSYKGLTTIVHAEAPLAELTDYAQTLRGMTSGLGLFSMKLKSYEVLAPVFAEKVIASRKSAEEGE